MREEFLLFVVFLMLPAQVAGGADGYYDGRGPRSVGVPERRQPVRVDGHIERKRGHCGESCGTPLTVFSQQLIVNFASVVTGPASITLECKNTTGKETVMCYGHWPQNGIPWVFSASGRYR